MAKRYTSTVQLHCWKQHTCSSCACVYSYILDRKITGTGASADQATASMKTEFVKAQRDDNDLQPCPNCGQYQPDMIGTRLAKRRKLLAFAAIVMPVLIPILRATYAVQANTLTWIAFYYCAAALAVHFFLTLSNPNRNREANRDLAANRIASGAMHVQPMTNDPNLLNQDTPALPRPTRSIAHMVTLALLVGALVLSLFPEMTRTLGGWPLNPECYPPVVGPGDTTRIYMTGSISSIKGYWRGTPEVTCRTPEGADRAGGGPPIPLESKTNQNNWGDSIEAKTDEQNSTSHPWVELTFPDNADLAGKTVTAHIVLSVEYPEMSGFNNFTEARQQMGRDVPIHLASRGAGGLYNGTWWTCILLSLSTVFVGSIVLVYVARSFQRQANPTQVFPVQQAAS